MSGFVFVRMKPFCNQWTKLYSGWFLLKFVENIQVWLKRTKITGNLYDEVRIFITILVSLLLVVSDPVTGPVWPRGWVDLLFHDGGTRRGWVVSSTPRPHFTPGKDSVPILQEAGWAPGPVWTGGKSRPHRNSIPDHPARSQSLYRLSYPAHFRCYG